MKKLITKNYLAASLTIALCVILAIKLLIGAFTMFFYLTGNVQEKQLTADDFEQINIERVDEMAVISVNEDPQMHLEGAVYNMYIKCDFSDVSSEFLLFHQDDLNKEFSADKVVYAKKYDDYYVFNLPLSTQKIRVDIVNRASVTINFEEIIINKASVKDVMRLSTGDLFSFVVIALLIYFCMMFYKENGGKVDAIVFKIKDKICVRKKDENND